MRRRCATRVLATAVATYVALLVSAPAASAHVSITPETVALDTFTTFTFTVPNEDEAEDTVGVDVALPEGFLLETAESVAGWETDVDRRRDGTPTAIHWAGGSLAPSTFGEFSMRGRVAGQPGPMSFEVDQRYETRTVSWSGPADAEQPAAILTVSEAGGGPVAGQVTGQGQPATPQVPLAPPEPAPVAAPDGTDDLARSRAALALVLALAALLIPLSILGMARLRRVSAETATPDTKTGVAPVPVQPRNPQRQKKKR